MQKVAISMKQEDIDCLGRIKKNYGEILATSARLYELRPEVLAGIMMRETRGGESKLLDIPGPGGRGDGGHGHGLFQIDDRSFPDWIALGAWSWPQSATLMACKILKDKKRTINSLCYKNGIDLDSADLERAMIASFNCGEGNVMKALKADKSPDEHTAHGDYSQAVLDYADVYKTFLDTEAPTAI